MQNRAGRHIQGFELMLAEIACFEVFAPGQLTRQQRQLARQGLDQGGFTGAVGAQQGQARPRMQAEID